MTHPRVPLNDRKQRPPLNVSELIEYLKSFPGNIPIVIDGYEGGTGRIVKEMLSLEILEIDGCETAVLYLTREGSPDQTQDGLFHALKDFY